MPPPHAKFFTRATCCLCDRPEAVLRRLAAEGLLTLEVQDIAGRAELEAQYGQRIPVVELSTGETWEGRISEFRLRRALEKPLA